MDYSNTATAGRSIPSPVSQQAEEATASSTKTSPSKDGKKKEDDAQKTSTASPAKKKKNKPKAKAKKAKSKARANETTAVDPNPHAHANASPILGDNSTSDVLNLASTSSTSANNATSSSNMAVDRLTQLQDCLDQLATQMYASLSYISTRHAAASIPDQPAPERQQPSTAGAGASSNPTTPAGDTATEQGDTHPPDADDDEEAPRPDSPTTFAAALRELSRDLVLKEQQVEALVASLPGVGSSRAMQEERMRLLKEELAAVEEEAKEAERVRVELVGRVEEAVRRCRRVVG